MNGLYICVPDEETYKHAVDEMADLKKRVDAQLDEMRSDLLTCSNMVFNLAENRQGEDGWGDVGTLTMLSAKIEELRAEIGKYVKRRIPDFPDRCL